MDEHLIALEERMQQLQETVRQALTQHDTFQVRLLGAELTRTQHAWNVLCGLSGAPDAVRPEPAPTVTEPHRDAPPRDRTPHVPLFANTWNKTGSPE
ncbi:hypothetical protein ACFYT7_31110 [Streptomyces sp. NPDC004041]|uniref:hypothetical protein n=1 Tax=Streptomyces sp. NPDC004041 TaxID=3364688 RepID=UPI0036C1AE2E